MKALPFLLLAAMLAPAQGFPQIVIEKIGAGFQFIEGPVWSPRGALVFSDIPADVIHVWSWKEGIALARTESGGANGNAFDKDGRLYTCEGKRRRVVRTEGADKLIVVADRFEGKRFNSPNDIVVRDDGHFYFTDPAFGSARKDRELPFHGVFHVTPRGAIEAISRLDTRPNGIALSRDGKTLYVTNSDERNVRAYDLDRRGEASNERVLIAAVDGVPDGMAVDESGNLYVACRGVAIYSPKGHLLRMVGMPVPPSNCAFGDSDGKSLYVTVRTELYRLRVETDGPSPKE